MDPNSTLRMIRVLIKSIRDDSENNTLTSLQLAESVEDLDEWLKKGGFLPEEWNHNPTPSERDLIGPLG